MQFFKNLKVGQALALSFLLNILLIGITLALAASTFVQRDCVDQLAQLKAARDVIFQHAN